MVSNWRTVIPSAERDFLAGEKHNCEKSPSDLTVLRLIMALSGSLFALFIGSVGAFLQGSVLAFIVLVGFFLAGIWMWFEARHSWILD